MNDQLEVEQERYELFEGPAYRFSFNRRQFLKAFSGGIALIVPMSNVVAHTLQQEQGESGRNRASVSRHRATNSRPVLCSFGGLARGSASDYGHRSLAHRIRGP